MEIKTDKTLFDQRLNLLKTNFSTVLDDAKFKWGNINSILMLKIRKNWTTESSNSNYQINSDHVKDFFPVIQMTEAFPHWRLAMPAFISNAVLQNFATPPNTEPWINASLSYRHKIQNSYPYLQLTLEDDLRLLKNSLKENDQIFFLKEQDTTNYFVFATRTALFEEDSILIIDPTKASSDKTKFELADIQQRTAEELLSIENVIYYGPPGTGKTREIFHKFINKKDATTKEFITFHQAYSYEEFIEGIKPNLRDKSDKLSYEYSDGVFYASCDAAAKLAGYRDLNEALLDTTENRKNKFDEAIKANKIFTFCIDEINRANIAGVFGDLITLIETNKRLGSQEELVVKLPYSKRSFGVPSNLRIVGSMNTADRSITLIDTALRRRFRFIEISPNLEILSEDVDGININLMLSAINNRIRYFLGKDQCIGHAYLLNKSNRIELLNAFTEKIIPLLEEYFYNDSRKISLVLGDSNKNESSTKFYIEDKNFGVAKLFPGAKDDDIDDKSIFIANPKIMEYLKLDSQSIPAELFTKIYN